MISPIQVAAEALAAAVGTVEGVRVYTDPGAQVDPPGVVIGPPRLRWEAHCLTPSSATFIVFLVVVRDDRAMPRLWDLIPKITEALDEQAAATTTGATPGVLNDLPCYEITVEVTL